jgi:hypothetical protein
MCGGNVDITAIGSEMWEVPVSAFAFDDLVTSHLTTDCCVW